MTDCAVATGTPEYVLIARRNNSLSRSGRLFAFGFIVSIALGIAVGFFLVCGAWLVLPFAGLEVIVLCLAFRCIDRHAGDYECVAIAGNSVSIEVMEGCVVRHYEFNRHWARLIACAREDRIALRSHGKEVEIGRHLCEGERQALARALGERLRRPA